jgi:hypothetical protein
VMTFLPQSQTCAVVVSSASSQRMVFTPRRIEPFHHQIRAKRKLKKRKIIQRKCAFGQFWFTSA